MLNHESNDLLLDKRATKVAFVIPTLGSRQVTSELVSSLISQNLAVVVVEQSRSSALFHAIEMQDSSDLCYVRMPIIRGASAARNIGISKVANSCDYLMFLNDTCFPNPNFLDQAGILLNAFPDLGAVCGSDRYAKGNQTWAISGVLRPHDLMKVNESAFVVRKATLKGIGNFDENLGTGSSGYIRSGEGADLLLRALNIGWKIYGLNEIAGTDSRVSVSHNWKIDLMYGVGFSHIARKNGMYIFAFLRVSTPLIRYILRRPLGDSPAKILNVLGVTVGRALGLFLPTRILLKNSKKDK